MDTNNNIKKKLESKRKEYEEDLSEAEMLSKALMKKDKEELVGIIMGILISKEIK